MELLFLEVHCLFPVVSKLIFLGLLLEYRKREIRILKKLGIFLAAFILPLGHECQKDESGAWYVWPVLRAVSPASLAAPLSVKNRLYEKRKCTYSVALKVEEDVYFSAKLRGENIKLSKSCKDNPSGYN